MRSGTLSVSNTSNASNIASLSTFLTANIYDASLVAGTVSNQPSLSVTGGSGSYSFANYNYTSPVSSGVVNINGAASGDRTIVLLDLASGSASTLASTLISAGFPSANITTGNGLGNVLGTYSVPGGRAYDLALAFTSPGAAANFSFDFLSFDFLGGATIANIAVVPEPGTLVGLLAPAAMLMGRRRRC